MAGKDTRVGASEVAEENVVVERGRDPLPPAGGKKGGRGQSKSRDAIASLDGRACVLEEVMGDVKDRLGIDEQNLQTLEDHVLEELESLKKAVTTQDELRTRFMELFANLQEQLDVQELQRQGVKDIDEAIAVAESLMEYARVGDSSKGKNAQVASKGNHAKGGGDKPKAWHKGNNQASTSKSEGHGKLEERRAKNKPKDGCFFCGGPHWARDCPRQGKLNALVEEKEKSEKEAVHMGSLQILNALYTKAVVKIPTGEGQASTGKGLLYVEAKLNGKPTQVMVDWGATHNFVTVEEAKRLGPKVVGGGGWLKSVNTNAKPLQGAARQVEMCLGTCRGLVDFSVAPMDDFKVVIGLDFLRQVNALVSPYNNAVHIMEKGASCVVPMSVGTSSTKTLSSMQLSAMQIVKGVKKREATYLAALKMEDNVGVSTEPLLREIKEILEANKDGNIIALPSHWLATTRGEARWQRKWLGRGMSKRMWRSYLDKAARKMKKWADMRREPKEYNLGDMVMVKLLPQQFKSLRKVHKWLIRNYEGPFPIVAKVGEVSYWLELPPRLKIHPVFHVSSLKSHYVDKEDPSRGESHRAPTTVVKSYDKEAEYVLSDALERRRGVPPTRHYLLCELHGEQVKERKEVVSLIRTPPRPQAKPKTILMMSVRRFEGIAAASLTVCYRNLALKSWQKEC
ncbi:hypothetical protein RJ640_027904 [Escallonia rubra]|uniref:Tf2-1-like SH3-like domain-containing protein n=1 Tax=Escallonia rubra TaxID=112253 RepID=A0AA88QRA5_9ASTE|nr:hypothetical protein RJ640_027904 [Escallonia rubra]